MSIEAMKLALEALEDINSLLTTMTGASFTKLEHAAAHLRQAIEQAQKQEPVAEYVGFTDYAQTQDDANGYGKVKRLKFIPLGSKLYTFPPQRQPLTDEEIKQVFGVGYVAKEFVEFVKAIEKAHGIGEKE